MKCPRLILGIIILHRIQNTAISDLADVNKIINEIMKEKISKWFGHVCRKKNTSIEYIVHTKDFVNPRPGGRSPKM